MALGIKSLCKVTEVNYEVYNGHGVGYSVLQMIEAFEKVCGQKINYKIAPRREGDVAECYASPAKAERELGFKAERGLEEMCADLWRFQTLNPNGYE